MERQLIQVGQRTVQFAAFAFKDNAIRKRDDLKKRGYIARVVEDKGLYKVQGPKNFNEAVIEHKEKVLRNLGL